MTTALGVYKGLDGVRRYRLPEVEAAMIQETLVVKRRKSAYHTVAGRRGTGREWPEWGSNAPHTSNSMVPYRRTMAVIER